jgi:hypothetical protein
MDSHANLARREETKTDSCRLISPTVSGYALVAQRIEQEPSNPTTNEVAARIYRG